MANSRNRFDSALIHDGGGVIFWRGWKLSRTLQPSARKNRHQVESARNRLTDSAILTDHNDTQYIFSEDYIFNTPSGAAMVILGRSSNGWVDWKNDQGQTLHDVKRAAETVEERDDE